MRVMGETGGIGRSVDLRYEISDRMKDISDARNASRLHRECPSGLSPSPLSFFSSLSPSSSLSVSAVLSSRRDNANTVCIRRVVVLISVIKRGTEEEKRDRERKKE